MTAHVVIVDDSLTVRMDLAEAFRGAGLSVVLCSTLSEAHEALGDPSAALLVLDVELPDGDGVDFLRQVRANARTSFLPVLLLSTAAEVADRIRGLTHGANEYVGKPYDPTYVVARAVSLLGSPGRREGNEREVLIIDDSVTFREHLAEHLREAGYAVTTTESAEEGLRIACSLRPAAIVVDGVMPGMDGMAFVRRIRLDAALNATPCLLLTASETAVSEIMALDSGTDAYLRKSEGVSVVLARLAAMLRSTEEWHARAAAKSLQGPKRILAVDDSSTYLEEIAENLGTDGYEVVKARSGEAALELLRVETVDAILLDVMMPGLSGPETCRCIKSVNILRNIPLIMLTSLDDSEALIDGINSGADDYVVKSTDFQVIRARLRAQLRRKQFEDENRRMRELFLHQEAETREARATSEARAVLLEQVATKNKELEALNEELQMFAYSVSHDLRQPLRSIDGFTQLLSEECETLLSERGRHYMERVRASAQRMHDLIEGMLVLSRVSRQEIRRQRVELADVARRVMRRLLDAEPHRDVHFVVAEPLWGYGDPQLLESVLENLLGNAWKFTASTSDARIELGSDVRAGVSSFFVRDNGAGFASGQVKKLFRPFQRLHSAREFPGTGIGLATVQRVIHRHGGEIWAEGAIGEGATFYFTLPSGAEQALVRQGSEEEA